jgi:signal peptidase
VEQSSNGSVSLQPVLAESIYWHPPVESQGGANLFVVVKTAAGRLKAAKLTNGFATVATTADLPFESTFLARLKPQRKKFSARVLFMVLAYFVAALLVAGAVAIFSGAISARVVLTTSMQGTINQGDVVVAANWQKPNIGQIAIYQAKGLDGKVRAEFVHRVISGSETSGYIFKGDNNPKPDLLKVRADQIVGVVQFWIPKLGFYLQPFYTIPFFVFLVGIYFVVVYLRRRARELDEEAQMENVSMSLLNGETLRIEKLEAGAEIEVYTWAEAKPQNIVHLLLKAARNGGVKVEKFSGEREKGIEEMQEVKPRIRRSWYWLGSLALVVLVLAGLRVANIFAFEHVQVGPSLPLGNANTTLAAVSIGEAKLHQFAVAEIDGKRNMVRVDGIGQGTYKVATTTSTVTIPANKLEGPIDFFIPFIGYLWLPFGQ